MEEATAAAAEAFKSWKEVPVQQRARVNLKYQQLIRDNMEPLAALSELQFAHPPNLVSTGWPREADQPPCT